jgi:hypothetical protein
LLIRKLDGLVSCERLAMPDRVYVYACTVRNGRKVLVAFYDDHIAQNHDEPLGSTRIELRFAEQRARVTHIIKELDATEARVEQLETKAGKLELEITEYPIFIEPL